MEALDPTVAETAEGFDLGQMIALFTLDATDIGGAVSRFAPAPVDGAAPQFDGHAYKVIPFKSKGWAWAADGPLPNPTLTFQIARNPDDFDGAAALLMAQIAEFDDLIGAKVTRKITFRKHLDDGDDPNPDGHFGEETYYVEQKEGQEATEITFKLSSALDVGDIELPRRQAVNHCQWIYRRAAIGGGFDYTGVTCPYTGEAMFNEANEPVETPAEDRCNKRLPACRLRFGANAALPFGGFPGVGRFRR